MGETSRARGLLEMLPERRWTINAPQLVQGLQELYSGKVQSARDGSNVVYAQQWDDAAGGPFRSERQEPLPLLAQSTDQERLAPSDKLIDFITQWEGFRPYPYKVGGKGNWTVGYGHELLEGENYANGILEEKARELLKKELNERYAPLVRQWALENGVKPSQQQFDALVSFVYNNGSIGDTGTKTIANVIKSGTASPKEIKDAFGLYSSDGEQWLPGLYNRRMNESDMYLYGDYRRKE